MKIVSGHQPVYLPWLGLVHKASLCDVFVYMDDVQYLVGDWNNRNRIKVSSNKMIWLTVPISLKFSQSRRLCDIVIADEGRKSSRTWQARHWKAIQCAYGKAPFFKTYAPFFEWLYVEQKWTKLSELNLVLLKQIFNWFGITPKIVIGSEQNFNGKKSNLVLNHGIRFGANVIVTGTLGKNYINVHDFQREGIQVVFQEYCCPTYRQRFSNFFQYLSCIDLLFSEGPASKDICLRGNVTKEDLWKLVAN